MIFFKFLYILLFLLTLNPKAYGFQSKVVIAKKLVSLKKDIRNTNNIDVFCLLESDQSCLDFLNANRPYFDEIRHERKRLRVYIRQKKRYFHGVNSIWLDSRQNLSSYIRTINLNEFRISELKVELEDLTHQTGIKFRCYGLLSIPQCKQSIRVASKNLYKIREMNPKTFEFHEVMDGNLLFKYH